MLTYLFKGNFKKIARFGRNVLNIETSDDKETAKETIKALEIWFSELGAPTKLGQVNIPETAIGEIARNSMGLIRLWGMSYPQPSVENILKKAI